MSEKVVPGDGRTDVAQVIDALGLAADQVVAFDMEALATSAGSVISSSLFGALAGSGSRATVMGGDPQIRQGGGRVVASFRASL